MKKLTLLCWLITVMLIGIASSSIMSSQTQITATAKDIFLPEGSFVIFREETDINADGKNETVYVYAQKEDETKSYCENINIAAVSYDGLLRRTSCNNVCGNLENVHIGDFNADGQKDILIVISNGENKSCMIGDFSHSIPKNIVSKANLKGLQMRLNFTDGFAISAELENGQVFSVNVSAHKEKLQEGGFFNENGKALKGTPILSPLVEIKPIEHDFGSNLLFTQRLYVKDNNMLLCNIEAEMEYTDDTLLIKRIEYYIE